jgi:hypothetical protein
MTDEDRAAAQARVREKVAQRAALARRKTAERKLVRWAGEVGPNAIRIVEGIFGIVNETASTPIIKDPGWFAAAYEHRSTVGEIIPAISGMPPPPKFEDER